MDKIDVATNYNHGITLIERKSLVVSGVKKIENFDEQECLMETTMGYLNIKGTIKGINYIEEIKNKDKEQGIFNRLFK